MFETPAEMAQLQRLLDESYERAGAHLLAIHITPARITAHRLVAELQGMHVFVVASTTSAGEPRTGPVDCFLYRGEVRFGTSADAHRARHLARSRAVSATHVRGEGLVVTVHGDVEPLDLEEADRDFGEYLRNHYGDLITSDTCVARPTTESCRIACMRQTWPSTECGVPHSRVRSATWAPVHTAIGVGMCLASAIRERADRALPG